MSSDYSDRAVVRAVGVGRAGLKRRLWTLRLNLVAAAITVGITVLTVQAMWNERQDAWERAERASGNLLTTLTRDVGGDIAAVDLSIKRVIQGLGYQGFERLPPEIRHRILFDQAGPADFSRTLLLLSKTGDLIADGGPVIAQRDLNFGDAEFFKVQREHPFVGLYISRPYESRIKPGSLRLAVSRRFANPDGEFAGVVAAEIALTDIQELFQKLNTGPGGSITLFRNDGTVLMRLPYDAANIGRDLSETSNFQRFRREGSGSFIGVAAIDQVRRLYTFGQVDDLPMILTVSLSAADLLAPWWRKALILALIATVLCGAVFRLLFMFRRELRRRTRAEKTLEKLARIDELTGLPNRRAFDKAFDREWRQAIHSGSSLSLLFADVDHFKGFNDRYGHARGDRVLRAIADTVAGTIRGPHDFAARYGGEEFTVILPETKQSGAYAMAEAIRQAVSDLGIEHERSDFGVATVSIGVATARPTQGSDAMRLLDEADASLYEAKAAGRNRVSFAASDFATQWRNSLRHKFIIRHDTSVTDR